jgi:hypothetical protein
LQQNPDHKGTSNIATIQTIDIADMTDINTVTVNVTGSGNYEYSLNDPYGPFQSSNFFDNVPAGIHEVYKTTKWMWYCQPTYCDTWSPKFFTQMATDIMTIGT